eukprot:COSAG01_NODE_7341_length_3242_cov_64.478300_2_plen_44_part_00
MEYDPQTGRRKDQNAPTLAPVDHLQEMFALRRQQRRIEKFCVI